MTLQNLSKILDKYEQQLGSMQTGSSFKVLKGLPFYDWSTKMTQSSITTFNNAISLPQKNGITYPLFDYEQMLFDTLQN